MLCHGDVNGPMQDISHVANALANVDSTIIAGQVVTPCVEHNNTILHLHNVNKSNSISYLLISLTCVQACQQVPNVLQRFIGLDHAQEHKRWISQCSVACYNGLVCVWNCSCLRHCWIKICDEKIVSLTNLQTCVQYETIFLVK